MMLRIAPGTHAVDNVRERLPSVGQIKMLESDWEKIGKILVTGIVRQVKESRQANGEQIKQNAPSTRARKIKAGRAPIPLVDQFKRFIRITADSWRIDKTNKSVEVSAGGFTGGAKDGKGLAELVRYVQEAGYVGWFGVSKRTTELVKGVVADRIKKVFADAAMKKAGVAK